MFKNIIEGYKDTRRLEDTILRLHAKGRSNMLSVLKNPSSVLRDLELIEDFVDLELANLDYEEGMAKSEFYCIGSIIYTMMHPLRNFKSHGLSNEVYGSYEEEKRI